MSTSISATRGASTTIEIGAGQSFVLAGLISSSQSNSREQIPYLGDAPVLGAFFKHVNNSRERQELIIVATPHLVSPVEPEDLPALPGSDMRQYDPSFGQILFNSDPLDDRVVQFGLKP